MGETLNHYKVIPDGGRVKSAGFPMDAVFAEGERFKYDPGPQTAQESAVAFQEMRSNASYEFRARFFPMAGREVKALLKDSPALYRPILKTDQGAGKFLGFQTGDHEGSLRVDVASEQGYVIEEAYLISQLISHGCPEAVMAELSEVKKFFREQDLPEARMAFERLEIEAENAGIVFRREAQVGRNGLMFIHPAGSDREIVFPANILTDIEQQVGFQLEGLFQLASSKQKEFAEKNNLPQRPMGENDLPFYLQADIHYFPDGEVKVAEIQIPDVGLFLSGLKTQDGDSLRKVQEVMEPIKRKIIDRFVQIIEQDGRSRAIYLVTRSEVVEHEEDVLEIRELREIKEELAERDIHLEIISASAAVRLDEDSLLFLFNLDPNSEEFSALARAFLTNSELSMVPSPFMRMAEREITEYQNIKMSVKQLSNIQALVGEVASLDRPEKIYSQIMAVDNFLRQMDIEEEVLHFYHPAISTPIAAYRYDIRSLHIASKILNERGLRDVALRSIPISPDRGVLFDKNGGTLYATFRFMFLGR